MAELFDAHCHVADGYRLEPAAAAADPVRGRLLCGTSPGDWPDVIRAARDWPTTVPGFGLHPWFIREHDWETDLATLEDIITAHPHAWLAEIGLDALRRDAAPEPIQEAAFSRQLRLAATAARPVNLHCVKACERLVALLDRDYLASGPRPFIVHSFSGPYQYVAPLAERGAYFSVGQLTSTRDTRKNRERAALIPAERLLLESDQPLTPRRDAVAALAQTLDWLAGVRTTDRAALAETIAANARRISPDV